LLRETETTKDTPIENVSDDRLKKAIDVEIVNIVSEKLYFSYGLDVIDDVPIITSNDANRVESAEV
jgi:hypothetical protein